MCLKTSSHYQRRKDASKEQLQPPLSCTQENQTVPQKDWHASLDGLRLPRGVGGVQANFRTTWPRELCVESWRVTAWERGHQERQSSIIKSGKSPCLMQSIIQSPAWFSVIPSTLMCYNYKVIFLYMFYMVIYCSMASEILYSVPAVTPICIYAKAVPWLPRGSTFNLGPGSFRHLYSQCRFFAFRQNKLSLACHVLFLS